MTEQKSFVLARVLPATQEQVFECWSDPASMGEWMKPGAGIAGATVEMDFRVGGTYRIVMHGEQDFVQHGEFLEIDEPNRIVMTWVSEFVAPEDANTRVTVVLEPAGDGQTRLTLTHHQLPANDTYKNHEDGWAAIADALGSHLEGRSGG